jgi:hypothetical protein
LDSLESGDQYVEDFEAYRRHELAFASPALADDLIGVGGTAIYPSFSNGRPSMAQGTE